MALAVTVSATLAMSRVAFTSNSPSEHLWLLYFDIPNAPVIPTIRNNGRWRTLSVSHRYLACNLQRSG